MSHWRTLAEIRREYGDLNLNEENIEECPITQFKHWFEDVLLSEKSDPTAMVLSTVDEKGYPDSRVVLLKGLDEGTFIFYTNYGSSKSVQLGRIPYAALNFYWPQMARQVRIRGRVKRTTKKQSDTYFASRPVTSQLSAIASPQSQKISDRKSLEQSLNELIEQHGQEPIVRPRHWGGYIVIPDEIEFWQGRDNRLHDRIFYYKSKGQWIHCRLAP
ncbi:MULTISPECIES: pyridoxamine 5'-phosphate oxidase [unclassified Legionella]|uniref:pyridoxamine 5'-phosphate oxidase n=1 Tax=unclassified Legionella TaxID=2622702 RepID=UPI001E378AE1|nr:pyridoxamine 5'-phosphate oxidase [Legionella sp. 31fI33]MCC5016288.1 pyridoxamine 5'-phosphate oxidase [Legionella sp. 31fI33]